MRMRNNRLLLPVNRRNYSQAAQQLRLTPYAWAKLLFLRDAGNTEVGGFAISSPEDLLLIEDVCLVKQETTLASVVFDDASVADYFDRQADRGLTIERFARIWFHTHPGSSPLPSGTDEATFVRCFGGADWSVMFILAAGGQAYARLRMRAGPGTFRQLPVAVDFRQPFPASDPVGWWAEYAQNVVAQPEWPMLPGKQGVLGPASAADWQVADANSPATLNEAWGLTNG